MLKLQKNTSALLAQQPQSETVRLFKVYQDYSNGRIDSSKFIYNVDKEFGATAKLRSEMRRYPHDAELSKV